MDFASALLTLCFNVQILMQIDSVIADDFSVTDIPITWFDAKNTCNLAGKSVAKLDADTDEIKSIANITNQAPFTAWIDAYRPTQYFVLNTGCRMLYEAKQFHQLEEGSEPRACALKCTLTNQIALQGSRCYCLSDTELDPADIDHCNSTCEGDGSQYCGSTFNTSVVSLYTVVNLSGDMCPYIRTVINDGGNLKYGIVLSQVNCLLYNLDYLCRPKNNKDFQGDVFNTPKTLDKANSSCARGLAELYHAHYNFDTKNPELSLGPSYYINFLRGISVVIAGDYNTSSNISTCFALERTNETDRIVELPCSTNLSALCHAEDLTQQVTSKTTTFSTEWSSVKRSETIQTIVIVIVAVLILVISLSMKIICRINKAYKRKQEKSFRDRSVELEMMENNCKVENSDKTINAQGKCSLFDKNKVVLESDQNSYQKPECCDSTTQNETETDTNSYCDSTYYSGLNLNGKNKQQTMDTYDHTTVADDMYNVLSLHNKQSQHLPDDTYDHIVSNKPVNNNANSNKETST